MVYQCACCGYFTVVEMCDTCPVCWWEESKFQEELVTDSGGPNSTCLLDARENFKAYGAMEERFISMARPPEQDELADDQLPFRQDAG